MRGSVLKQRREGLCYTSILYLWTTYNPSRSLVGTREGESFSCSPELLRMPFSHILLGLLCQGDPTIPLWISEASIPLSPNTKDFFRDPREKGILARRQMQGERRKMKEDKRARRREG
jgi:hypothetical protein